MYLTFINNCFITNQKKLDCITMLPLKVYILSFDLRKIQEYFQHEIESKAEYSVWAGKTTFLYITKRGYE